MPHVIDIHDAPIAAVATDLSVLRGMISGQVQEQIATELMILRERLRVSRNLLSEPCPGQELKLVLRSGN